SRLFWFQALGIFGFFLLLMWVQGTSIHFSTRNYDGFIAGTSAQGLLLTLPTVLLLLVLLLPFVTADGVTRDLQRRTHELLLTTALPGWAYVWGRYLVGLLMGLALAGLVLCATLLMGWLLHLTVPLYPAPQIEAAFSLWIGLVVPATILVSSLSFALGTMFPRQSTLIKTAILVVWTVGAEILPFSLGSTLIPTWYSNWDPTGAVTALKILSQTHDPQLQTATSMAQFQQVLLSSENTMPSMGEWFIPHLILAAVSLGLVALAASTFQRSRVPLQG
ncbi:MAG TPA: ABC transporter permease, partial [Ktedonobacteraceae bacterium]|nr:ABC transporter permease [Ktedonobacteraceae bacterium]